MCSTFVIYSDEVWTKIINWFLCLSSFPFYRPSLSTFFNSENVPRQRKRERNGESEREICGGGAKEKKRRDASSKTLAVCEWRWMANTIKVRSLEKCRSVKRVILAPRVRKYALLSARWLINTELRQIASVNSPVSGEIRASPYNIGHSHKRNYCRLSW